MGKAFKHFCTITNHKILVMKACFKVGLYWQGIMHDMSKYSPSEFLVGCKYYQGTRSPNNAEREEKGYSSAWLHHKGRNKHHLEYWIDYGIPQKGQASIEKGSMIGMKMPLKYVVEMFLDRIAASKNYQKDKYTDLSPLAYYEQGKAYHMMHPDTERMLEYLLHMLARSGEAETFRFIRYELLKGNVPYDEEVIESLEKSNMECANGYIK